MKNDVIIHDFNDCVTNKKTYGGMAGSKLGINYNNANWLLKFPRSTKSMNVTSVSYTTSPLSEYIGSHVYEILGFDVHKTILGIRDGKVVVACRDFVGDGERLQEFREIKNYYNEKLEEILDQTINAYSNISEKTHLEEVLIHLKYNPLLTEIDGILERFWDCIVVDGLINNNDRNSGNWGILYHSNDTVSLVPIYDNGASFSNKMSDEKIKEYLNDNEKLRNSATNTTTGFSLDNKDLNFSKMLLLDNPNLKKSILKLVPIIEEKMNDIEKMINDIPNEFNNIEIISNERKEFYIKGMKIRLQELLIPIYNKIKNEIQP